MTKLVSKKELRSVMGVPYSPQHIARLEAVGRFPRRIQLGPNRVAWLQVEIEKWIEERIAASRTPDARTAAAKEVPVGNRRDPRSDGQRMLRKQHGDTEGDTEGDTVSPRHDRNRRE